MQTAEERGVTVEVVTDDVKAVLEEMGHNFNLSSIRVMAFMLRKILCTLFRRVLVNREGLERVCESFYSLLGLILYDLAEFGRKPVLVYMNQFNWLYLETSILLNTIGFMNSWPF